MEEYQTNQADVYTDNPGKAVKDFCLGFFGIWFAVFVFYMSFGFISNFLSFFRSSFLLSSIVIYAILGIGGIILFRAKGRRYIGIGILVSFLIPLLVFGACLILIAGLGGF